MSLRKGPVVHGALLVVALGLAYQTWTRDKSAKPKVKMVDVWSGAPGAVERITYETERRKLEIERRSDAGGAYLWATVTTTTTAKPPKPPVTADAGPEDTVSTTDDTPTVTVQEYPVGEEGEKLLAQVAPLQAVRDLGPLTDERKKDYGLEAPKTKLIVRIGGASREMVVGGPVYGQDHRYALDPTTQKVYVLPGDLFKPLGSDPTLREKKLHAFDVAEVTAVMVEAGGKSRQLSRRPGQASGAPATWADAATPAQPDQTLANFMDRVDALAVVEYVPKLDEAGLEPVLTVEYKKGSAVAGRLELVRKPSATAGQFDYYVRTERTRVRGKVNPQAAQRVEQDLAAILGP